MNKMRIIQFYAALIIVSLMALLTVYAYKFKKFEKYYDLESSIVQNAKTLMDYKDEADKGAFASVIIPQKELSNTNLIVKNDECSGYVKLNKYLFVYSYKAYIKCDDYKTSGYKKTVDK